MIRRVLPPLHPLSSPDTRSSKFLATFPERGALGKRHFAVACSASDSVGTHSIRITGVRLPKHDAKSVRGPACLFIHQRLRD
jgi:hypothetical protein